MDFIFGSEFNVIMPDADSDRYILSFDSEKKDYNIDDIFTYNKAKELDIYDLDKILLFKMELSEKLDFWCFPIKTISQSEKSFDLNYQSTVFFPYINLKIEKNEIKSFYIDIEII